MKRILASEWTAGVICIVVVAAHVVWFNASAHQGDVLSGLGGSLTAVGIFVATQPYIRKGLVQTAREQVGLESTLDSAAHEGEAESEGLRHVVQERVVGVVLVAIGSMLNGYGVAIAHLLDLRGG